ncbi:hypothetical protein RSSM_06571 [Rhodopirellula sallentina SM41]|uniref:Uncharacterized protein n=1 Tax=Rhodopirellula sallentina SM41 TaxID=1263870 RepID=M5U2C7_9BACT|nr:hypothetical protein RSSM_06571 [Rhodopirellula sallentina SM41]
MAGSRAELHTVQGWLKTSNAACWQRRFFCDNLPQFVCKDVVRLSSM